MTSCAYCEQPATTTIVSTPEQVCVEHAVEFWTGLLVFARDCRRDPCMKHQGVCTCRLCEGIGASSLRAVAVDAAGPAPRKGDRFPFRLAS
jgi:hypothetical protein